MLKRLVSFLLTLIFGVALVSLAAFVKTPMRNAVDGSATQGATHSKTWLFIHDVPAPTYTEREAREKCATDTLRLRALLDADGTVSQVELLSTASKEFADDAMSAAKRILFRPATEDEKPIPLWVTVDYSCSGGYFGHRYEFGCEATVKEVERDWRTIHE